MNTQKEKAINLIHHAQIECTFKMNKMPRKNLIFPAISFGSCMAGSTVQAIRAREISELKFVSRVLHNRIDQFLNCFVRSTRTPIEWLDIAPFLNQAISREQIADLRLYILNQDRIHMGRHAIEIENSFFEAISSYQDSLIVIDNYMDIASRLLFNPKTKRSGFVNWGALEMESVLNSFQLTEYLSADEYLSELRTFLKFLRSNLPCARIALILFPSKIEYHDLRPAIANSSMINSAMSRVADEISKEFNILIHQARDVQAGDLSNVEDWSHYTKSYYTEIADKIISWMKSQQELSLGNYYDMTQYIQSYTVTVVIQFFQDFDHIRDVIKSLEWADEIFINDGPFTFAKPILEDILETENFYRTKSENYFVDLRNSTGANIIYNYAEHENEAQKRIFGYSQVKSDIVLSVDADEVLDITKYHLNKFVKSDALVGMFECVNLSHNSLCVSRPNPIVDNSHPRKPFAFKRSQVSGEKHLDYLWILGTPQNKNDTADYYLEPICKGLRLTNIRGVTGAAVKFAFYTALAWNENQQEAKTGPFADCLYYFGADNGFSTQLKATIMSNALASSTGFLDDFSLSSYAESASATLALIEKEKAKKFMPDTLVDHCMRPLLPGIPCYLNVNEFEELTIYLNHSAPVQILLHYYYQDRPSESTHRESKPHFFDAVENKPNAISRSLLDLEALPFTASLGSDSQVFLVLQICCWSGPEVKETIKFSGIPVYASLHLK
jgi:hypothetical protein